MKNMITLTVLFLLSGLFSCSKNNDSYYPLDEEKTWTYQVSVSSFQYGNTVTTEATLTNFPPRELGGRKVTPQKLDMGNHSYFNFISANAEGIYEFGSQSSATLEPEIREKPNYFIKYPIEIGKEWNYEANIILVNDKKIPVTLKSRIESVDEIVTIPAGTFKDCVKIKSTGIASAQSGYTFGASYRVDIIHYYYYAPGVGNIKSVVEEKSDNFFFGSGTMTMQLESYKE